MLSNCWTIKNPQEKLYKAFNWVLPDFLSMMDKILYNHNRKVHKPQKTKKLDKLWNSTRKYKEDVLRMILIWRINDIHALIDLPIVLGTSKSNSAFISLFCVLSISLLLSFFYITNFLTDKLNIGSSKTHESCLSRAKEQNKIITFKELKTSSLVYQH